MSHRRLVVRAVAASSALLLIPVAGIPLASPAYADAAPPAAVTDLKVFTHVGAVTLTWDLSADADLEDTVVQLRVGSTAPATPTDGVLVTDPDGAGPQPAAPNLVVPSPGNVTWVDGLDPGTDFTFGLFARDDSGNISPVTTRTIRGVDVALTVSRSRVVYGGGSTFTATLRRSTGSAAVPGVPVAFYVRERGTKPWYFLEERNTNSSGTASVAFNPGLNLEVQAYFFGGPGLLGSAVNGVEVDVAQKVGVTTNYRKRKKGKPFTLTGTIVSKVPGSSAVVQRLVGSTWRKVATVRYASVKTTGGTKTARLSWKVTPARKGAHNFRIITPASSRYVASVSSKVKLRVR